MYTEILKWCRVNSKSRIAASQQDLEIFEQKLKSRSHSAQQREVLRAQNDTMVQGIKVIGKRNFGVDISDATYRKMLQEIDESKVEHEDRLEKIKKFLENLEKRHFDANLEILKRTFIYDVSALKSVEYDLNKIIEVRLSGV